MKVLLSCIYAGCISVSLWGQKQLPMEFDRTIDTLLFRSVTNFSQLADKEIKGETMTIGFGVFESEIQLPGFMMSFFKGKKNRNIQFYSIYSQHKDTVAAQKDYEYLIDRVDNINLKNFTLKKVPGRNKSWNKSTLYTISASSLTKQAKNAYKAVELWVSYETMYDFPGYSYPRDKELYSVSVLIYCSWVKLRFSWCC